MSLIALNLTDRQKEILTLARDGLTYKEIAAELEIANETVRGHLAEIRQRLNALNTTQAVTIAIRCRYIPLKRRLLNG